LAPKLRGLDREMPSRDSIKTALDLLKNGEILLIFPSGTRSDQSISFKRGRQALRRGQAGEVTGLRILLTAIDQLRSIPRTGSATTAFRGDEA